MSVLVFLATLFAFWAVLARCNGERWFVVAWPFIWLFSFGIDCLAALSYVLAAPIMAICGEHPDEYVGFPRAAYPLGLVIYGLLTGIAGLIYACVLASTVDRPFIQQYILPYLGL